MQADGELVLFAGGGTAGHVFPGLAVIDELLARRSVRVAWVGSTRGIERGLVRRAGLPYHGVPAGKLRRYLSPENITDIFRVGAGIIRGVSLLRRLRPAVLFSKGGFVSVPPVIAARLCGVPVISHESDADPGLATRINGVFSSLVLVAYESTRSCFPVRVRRRVRVSGNPVRPGVLRGDRSRGFEIAGFDPDDRRPVALFLGGSLGAAEINELVADLLPRIGASWRVIHQTGTRNPAAIPPRSGSYFGAPFFGDELPHLLAAAGALVCRAGASTLWEGAVLGIPMILVPLRSGSRGDQVRNAAVFAAGGGALTFPVRSDLAEEVAGALERLAFDPAFGRRLARNARATVRTDATTLIADAIIEILTEREVR